MKLIIFFTILVAIILELVNIASSTLYCPSGYNHCSGSIWCCPDGYVCTGTSTCISIGTIVGAVIGALVGLAILIGIIIFCCRYRRQSRAQGGTVIQAQQVQYPTGVQPPQYGVQPNTGYGQPNTGYGQPNVGYQPPPPQTK